MWDLLVAAGRLLVAACERSVAACMQDLVPSPGVEAGSPALGVQSLTHWTTSEVPESSSLKKIDHGYENILKKIISLSQEISHLS